MSKMKQNDEVRKKGGNPNLLNIKFLGPRGVGKSHILTLLVLNLRWEKIIKPKSKSFLYINDPSLYFQSFTSFIKRDVEFFLCEELSDPAEESIRKDFENVNWYSNTSILDFLMKTIDSLEKRGQSISFGFV